MKLKFIFFIFILFFITGTVLPQNIKREICISVDDLPYITKVFGDIRTGQSITGKLLTTFKKYNVIALGSVNSRKLIVK